MRPEHVVRKYNQQQRYTQKLKMKNSKEEESEDSKSSSLNAIANKRVSILHQKRFQPHHIRHRQSTKLYKISIIVVRTIIIIQILYLQDKHQITMIY